MRPRFLPLLWLLAAWLQILTAEAATPAEPTPPLGKRPNILFCFADDWGRYAGAYAALDRAPSVNQVLRTPNIDRLAQGGALFRNAFVTAPSCTPCRSSLLSGQYFWRTGRGAILHGAIWDPAIPAFPLLLRDQAGYHLGKSYKVWSPGTPADAPFGGQRHAYEKAGRDFNNFSENATRLVREGLAFPEARDRILSQVRSNFTACLADRRPGQPFFFWFGPTLTHRTWEKNSGQALWGIDPEILRGKLPPDFPDVPEVRADVVDYLGEIQAWDAGIGVLLDALDASGERENTVVVVSGDHGIPGMPSGKCNLYDLGTAVALIAQGPGIPPGRVIDDFVNLIDLAPTFLEVGGLTPPPVMNGRSLRPLLTASRGGQIDPTRTFVVTGRERHVASARTGFVPYPQRALRTADFLFIRNYAPERWPLGEPGFATDSEAPSADALEHNTYAAFADMDASPTKAWLIAHRNVERWTWHYRRAFTPRPAEELYDLRHDPDQVRNAATDPAFASERSRLADQLDTLLRATGDPRVTMDPPTFERPPFTDPNLAPTPRRASPARP